MEVELPNGQIGEFPDDMPQDQIESVLRKQFPSINKTSGNNNQSFYDLSKEDQAKAMDLARQQISQQNPGMPNWFRDMMLSVTPKDKSPMLQKIANEAEASTNFMPVAAGGALQGFSLPFRGISSLIPTKATQAFANAPDYRSFFPKPGNEAQKELQDISEFAGSLGPLGKMFGAIKGASAAARVPKALQNAIGLAGTGAISTPGDVSDRALNSAGALALGGAGKLGSAIVSKASQKLPAILRGLTNESTPQALVESVQKPHDLLENTANTLYNQVRGAIQRRGIKVNVKPETLNEISEYPSMQTKTHKELINDAKSGDYEALHKLQSSLYRVGSKDMLNDDSVINTRGENILDLRNRINKELEGSLIQQGHADIAHVLRQGKNIYKQLQDTYFNKDLPKGIGKLVESDIRLVPENPEDLFSQNSLPMKRFLKQHPETAQHVQGIKEKEYAKKSLRNILIGSGVAGGATAGIKTLYDFL